MAWDDGLEGKALEIAASTEARLRVMAGPGTGKSFAMKRRAARLLEEGVNPERILAVTFTRNAARGLLDDLRNLDVPGCDEIRAGTLHGFCFSMLRHEAVFEYLGRVARPLVTFSTSGVLRFEAAPMLADLRRTGNFGGARDCTTKLRAFDAAWARLQSDQPGWPRDAIDRDFHRALLDWLRFHKSILIGELVPESLRYLRNNPGSDFRHWYDHVVVDEYQDLNRAEQELIDLIAENGHAAVVGDVDQSIYSFRYANPEGIIEYVTRHLNTRDEQLIECRRCPRRVVAVADCLIRHNHPESPTPRLSPFEDNPEGEVHVVQWGSLAAEAGGLAAYVAYLVNEHGYQPGEILILSQRRLIGYGVRDAIAGAGIPVHSFYQEELLEPDEAQLAFAQLTLLCDPDDRAALRWRMGYGSPSWRAGQYAHLRSYCEANSVSPRECLQQLALGNITIPHTNQLASEFRILQHELQRLEGIECAQLIEQLFPSGAEWAQPLRASALGCLDRVSDAAELLDALRTNFAQPEMPESGEFVRVMSLHKSKGLTSRAVIVAGCIEGLIPAIDRDMPAAAQASSLAEQRRLFYVAITRCREILVLSSVTRIDPALGHRMGARTGSGGRTIASRFLDELGGDLPEARLGAEWLEERGIDD